MVRGSISLSAFSYTKHCSLPLLTHSKALPKNAASSVPLLSGGASKGEVEAFLSQIGFVNTKANDYYHKEEGLVLEDLHDENVFVGENGNLLFVDPVIYLETADLNLGGVNLFRFPFGTSFK
jgi:hypothetical protein